MKAKKFELWSGITVMFLVLFLLFLVYPMYGILRQAVITKEGQFSLQEFTKFFSQSYYSKTILNSFKVSITVTLVTLVIGIPFSYFFSFYRLRGSKVLFVISVLCCMSAPFIGAYSWILLLGRSGIITQFLKNVFGIELGSIYGFKGILLVQSLKLFPLVFIYMNGAFKNIDNTLMEAAAQHGLHRRQAVFPGGDAAFHADDPGGSPDGIHAGVCRLRNAALNRRGLPDVPGGDLQSVSGRERNDHNFAAAISVIAIVVTAVVFFLQKWATGKYKFSINALHPIEKKQPKGIKGLLMYAYSYLLVAIAFLPQIYVVYLSFRNCDQAVFKPGYSLANYEQAMKKLLVRSIKNTVVMGVGALAIIIVISILIAYLVVRRASFINNMIDTMAMLPYIMPGSVIGIALVIAFGKKPFALTGTVTIMLISFVIRRMPYTIRSATATLMQIPMSIEEASISLGASKLKTFIKITVPMMSNGTPVRRNLKLGCHRDRAFPAPSSSTTTGTSR